jgi:hypothetical protein
MWLSVIASVLAIGASWSVVYFVYLAIHHSDVIFSARKNVVDIMKDSYTALIQYEQPPMFKVKATFSSGF